MGFGKIASGLCVLALCGPLRGLEFKPVVDLDLRGGYASVNGGTSSGLALGSLYVVPAMALEGGPLLLPNIYANASGQERSIEEDTIFVRTLLYGVRPIAKFKYSDSTSWQLRADVKRSMNVEALNESFGTGVYDYDEYGLGLGVDYANLLPLPFGLGLDFSHRGYPNFHGNASELIGNKNYYVKDFWDFKPSVKIDFGAPGRFTLAAHFKSYTDSYVYVEGLTIDSGQLQHDLLISADLRGGFPLNKAWQLSWLISDMNNSSNQSSIELSSNSFFLHSQDYNAFTLSPGLLWSGEKWSGDLSYSIVFRNLNRPIQNADTSYAMGTIADVEQGINGDLKRILGYNIKAVMGLGYRVVSSNQVSTQGGLPNYSFYNVNLGVQWEWQAK